MRPVAKRIPEIDGPNAARKSGISPAAPRVSAIRFIEKHLYRIIK